MGAAGRVGAGGGLEAGAAGGGFGGLVAGAGFALPGAAPPVFTYDAVFVPSARTPGS